MAASELTVRKRVTEILNACAAGTFSEAVDYDYADRNSLAIAEAVKEAALLVARAICSNPNHVHRNVYVSATPTSLTHAGELPDMSGEMDLIQIQPYEDANWISGVPRDAQQIEAFRSNPSLLYSALNHDAEDSPLGGYYAIAGGRFYFTGYAARGFFPVISRTTVGTLIPDEYQSTWVSLAVGMTVKEGDNLAPIAGYYLQIGSGDLPAIAAMGTVQPTPDPERARRARSDS
jgi:hypothetical protein